MSETAPPIPSIGHLLSGSAIVPTGPVAWLDRLRAEALERANALSVPTTRDEDWRFTDLSPLYQRSWQPADGTGTVEDHALSGLFLPEIGNRLVFVDGVFAGGLSSCSALATAGSAATADRSLYCGPLARALEAHPAAVESKLARLAAIDQVFAAANTAFLQDAAVVVVPAGATGGAVHVLHVATRPQSLRYARLLVVAEKDSEATVVEEYASPGFEGDYFVNAVSEIAVGDNAQVRHVRIQRDALTAFHIAQAGVVLGREARYEGQALSLGARISRYDPVVRFDRPGAQCRLEGVAILAGRQLADTHSFVDHAAAECVSRQVHKCIVDGGAHAVFNGKILVRPGAQRTDSSQQSRNLLLSGRARVDTKPQLEIFADDVKCAHGATVGQLDAEQAFYLQSRGLPAQVARNVLTHAFAVEVLERIPVASLRARLEEQVLARVQVQETRP